jgi:DNA-binding IclR family transcriptional regulator
VRNSNYTIESVDNALKLILMLQAEGSVRLSQAAKELGVARSTAHRLLGTLIGRGFAVQDERRRYLPGPAISMSPSLTTLSPGRLRTVAHPYLQSLSKRLGETVHLMIREGVRVQFLDSVESLQALRIGSRIGVILPAHVTSGGKAMLAELDRDDIVRLYRNEPDPPDLMPLLRSLTSVRQRGYGTNVGESERGVTAVGVRVQVYDASSVVAVTVSAPSFRLPRARIPDVAEMVHDVVRRIEMDLAEPAAEHSAGRAKPHNQTTLEQNPSALRLKFVE